ncbi:DUF1642 domain-containing protein [Streptococcus suis]|uniref:DUF1642 domain-containing protein n=1 Tax=Streptococcus suis TaxID=1307 RepID=UPI00300F863D
MNKHEALKQVEQMGEYENFVDEPISKKSVLNIISQIHEPQKVVVPKFVAEWIEACKTSRLGGQLNTALQGPGESFNNSEAINIWLEYPGNQETFASAWLYGYQVEQEQLYTVEIPNPNNRFSVVFLIKEKGKVRIGAGTFFGNTPDDKWKKDPNTHLTESEIKQDFEWAWRWAKPVEVE